jgi:hypothetical protein
MTMSDDHSELDKPTPKPNKHTHDADGNIVDGWYWILLEDSFQDAVETFRREGKDGAVALAWRLVATTDDVPAELVQRQQDFWNIGVELDEPESFWTLPDGVWDKMIAEIGRGEYAPISATVFITELIRRVTEAQGARWDG